MNLPLALKWLASQPWTSSGALRRLVAPHDGAPTRPAKDECAICCGLSMTKLLILSSDTGEGHNSASRALQIAASAAGIEASVRKPIEEYSANRILANLYNWLLARRPRWVGAYFSLIDRLRPNEVDFFYNRARRQIRHFVESELPDVILSVHPMLNHFIQRWVREQSLGIPCYTFVTDPFPPFWRGWSSPYIHRYFVTTPEAAGALREAGVLDDTIHQVPMPVRPEFRPAGPEEIEEFRTRLRLDPSPTILINGGARGGGPIPAIYQAVRSAAAHANILVVCGWNRRLQRRIEGFRDKKTRTFGFVQDIHCCVSASNLAITKPGAMSTYEAIASGVPVALCGIGGLMPQESGLFHAHLDTDSALRSARSRI